LNLKNEQKIQLEIKFEKIKAILAKFLTTIIT